MRSLRALLQVQGDFEAVAADALRGLGSLWARLEELHTTVTLTKEGGHGHGDLALARAEAEVSGVQRSVCSSGVFCFLFQLI